MAKTTSRSKTVKAKTKRKGGTRRSATRSTGWMDKAKLVGGLAAVVTGLTMFQNWQAGKTANPFTADYYK